MLPHRPPLHWNLALKKYITIKINKVIAFIIPIENWTCDNLVEHYRASLERKDWAYVLDNIKKDLQNTSMIASWKLLVSLNSKL
ncbi:hypothetical protein Glove_38g75 [Diversispora epigaea]|uniref:Uncharacterized protein n=1 Tax=Diversispora epigaea TaxID=1348612 RepID=A0A397JGW1_9GLOM|nr:hypothetical protein Glove_38g75 [Diversispora epigaea]